MIVLREVPSANPGCGRAAGWDAACSLAAESAQADFVCLLRRIHSLCRGMRGSLTSREKIPYTRIGMES